MIAEETENAKPLTLNETERGRSRRRPLFRVCVISVWGPGCTYVDELSDGSQLQRRPCGTQMQAFDLGLFNCAIRWDLRTLQVFCMYKIYHVLF